VCTLPGTWVHLRYILGLKGLSYRMPATGARFRPPSVLTGEVRRNVKTLAIGCQCPTMHHWLCHYSRYGSDQQGIFAATKIIEGTPCLLDHSCEARSSPVGITGKDGTVLDISLSRHGPSLRQYHIDTSSHSFVVC
jgi:hypothetical protein